MLAGPLALVALIAGWITTEVGRQPWVVYEVMRTEQAVTDAGGLQVVFWSLLVVYLSLLGRDLAAAPACAQLALRRGGAVPGGGGLMLPEICLALVIAGITAYAVLGGADFGGGFWDLTAGGAERGGRVRGMVERSMSPVWEANHVWLIFVLVIMWTCFPVAFGSIFSTLYVPMFIAVVGIIFRGTAFALRGQAATIGEARFSVPSSRPPRYWSRSASAPAWGRSGPAGCRSATPPATRSAPGSTRPGSWSERWR